MKLTPNKYFKASLLAIKYQSYVQVFLSQLDINFQGNKETQDRVTETTKTVKFHHQGHQLYPTTAKQRNAPSTPQVLHQEHLT